MAILRLLLLAAALCGAAVRADVAVPPLQSRVTDLTGTLDADQAAALEQQLAAFEQRKGSQIGVLIVPTTQPETIEQYGIRVAEAWQLGRKGVDDGAILILAKDDHHLRIEVGQGLEGALNDATCKRIIDEIIVPRLRNGDFPGGIQDGLARMMAVVDGEPLPPPSRSGNYGPRANRDGQMPVMVPLLLGAFFGATILRLLFGRPLAATISAVAVGVIAWFLTHLLPVALVFGVIGLVFGLLSSSGRGFGGGWGGGGGGFSSGGGSGGFSGGGGGFSGGGASGSW